MDRTAATDWLGSTGPGSLSWTAPTGVATAPQDWGLLYSFSFTTTAAPSAVGASSIVLGIEEAPGGQIVVPIMGPQVP